MAKVKVTLTAERTYNILKKDLGIIYPDAESFEDALSADVELCRNEPEMFLDEPKVKITVVGEVL